MCARTVGKIASVTLFLSLAACSQAEFSSKDGALSKSVFAEGAVNQGQAEGNGITNDASGNVTQPGGSSNDDASGEVGQERGDDPASGMVNQPDGTNNEIDFRLVCSDSRSEKSTNFKRALLDGKSVSLALDGKVCTSNPTELRALVTKKSFTMDDAKRLCPSLVPASGKWSNVELIVAGKSNRSSRGVIEMLYAQNEDNPTPPDGGDSNCDENKSPLVVHIASDVNRPQPISLSAPSEGVFFDLLGSKHNYTPVRISWFTNHDYRFLALPDENGLVHSIDQLFGDSTLGPDGKYAEDGYAALAKYDLNSDGFINRADDVFGKLRLWLDEDFDGVAQAHELTSLNSVGIVYIDLGFSTDFSETDQYGNQTKMKSVVGYEDGSLDLIFDLWFSVNLSDSK